MELLIAVLVQSVLLAGVYFVLSLGLNIILGVLDIVNFAHGAFVILGAYSTFYLYEATNLSPWLLIPLDMIVVGLIGALLYIGYLRFTPQSPLVGMFALIGFSSVVVASIQLTVGSNFRTIPVDYGSVDVLGVPVGISELIAFAIAIGLGIITIIWLNATKTGKAIRAIVDDRIALRLCGINDSRLSLLAFTVGGALAGAAGGAVSTYITFGPNSGLAFAIIAFAVVILGGLGDITGGAIASVIVAVVLSSITVYVSSALTNTALLIVVLMVLLLRPRGLLARGRL